MNELSAHLSPQQVSAIILGVIAIFTAKNCWIIALICTIAACTLLGGC